MVKATSQQVELPAAALAPGDVEGDLIQRGNPLFGIIWINPERMGGTPCFAGTRVPIQNLFDYVAAGEPLEEFLQGFPGVSRDQALAVIRLAGTALLQSLPSATS
jgi:uncharacterized protein (DUF433 family)